MILLYEYDSLATDNGICEYAEDYYDCDDNCISDIDSDVYVMN